MRRKIGRKILIIIISLFLIICLFSLLLPLSPTKSVINTIRFVISGRLHFPTENIGTEIVDKDGNKFTVFREVVVDPTQEQPKKPGVVLILHFRVSNMTVDQNKLFSLLPLPLYLGDPGFRRKLFTINKEYCQSIYEWDTETDAENYLKSIAIKTVIMRSDPGSFRYEIIKQ